MQIYLTHIKEIQNSSIANFSCTVADILIPENYRISPAININEGICTPREAYLSFIHSQLEFSKQLSDINSHSENKLDQIISDVLSAFMPMLSGYFQSENLQQNYHHFCLYLTNKLKELGLDKVSESRIELLRQLEAGTQIYQDLLKQGLKSTQNDIPHPPEHGLFAMPAKRKATEYIKMNLEQSIKKHIHNDTHFEIVYGTHQGMLYFLVKSDSDTIRILKNLMQDDSIIKANEKINLEKPGILLIGQIQAIQFIRLSEEGYLLCQKNSGYSM